MIDARAALYAVAGALVLTDTLDLLVRLFLLRRLTHGRGTSTPLEPGRFTPYQMRLHLRPFAVLASVHNLGAGAAEFVARLGRFRPRAWVIDDASTDDTVSRLEALDVRCVRGKANRKKPGAIRELLAHLPADIATVLVIDPDVELDGGEEGAISRLERSLFEFQRSRMAAFCPRIGVRRDGLWAELQHIEYSLALEIGRKGLGDHALTSGVSIYRRDALEKALAHHSLSVYAEDLSNALILLSADERIYYDSRLVFTTEGMRSFRRLFSQRVGWAFGLLQVFVRDFRRIVRATTARPLLLYHLFFYTGLTGLVLHPLRLAGFFGLALSALNGLDELLGIGAIPDNRWTDPAYAVLAYVRYSVLTLTQMLLAFDRADWRRSRRALALYPIYAWLQVIPTTVGYLNWFFLRVFRRRLFRDHYVADEALIRAQMASTA